MKIKMLTTSVIGRKFYTNSNEYEIGKDISEILADKLIAAKYAIKINSDEENIVKKVIEKPKTESTPEDKVKEEPKKSTPRVRKSKGKSNEN